MGLRDKGATTGMVNHQMILWEVAIGVLLLSDFGCIRVYQTNVGTTTKSGFRQTVLVQAIKNSTEEPSDRVWQQIQQQL